MNLLEKPSRTRDETGLSDEAYLDVLGRCVSAAIVAWLLAQLSVLDAGVVSAAALLASFVVVLYFVWWTSELYRQTLVYAGTWRYGVTG